MTDATTIDALTNDAADSCVDVQCNCPTLWSFAQEFCYLRLSNKGGASGIRLINYFPSRARRIAATYARLYLETEEHGTPAKKGRYYWMALGAFASKTVACNLELLRLSHSVFGETVRTGLGKGNFWLFNDIAAWHWYYSFSPQSFDQCLTQRNSDTFVEVVKAQVKKLPWAAESLGKINKLQHTSEVREAFTQTRTFEQAGTTNAKREAQFKNLMELAKHEQGNILQKLIYDDPDFAWWVQVQRGGQDSDGWGRAVGIATSWAAPKLKIAFVSACDTDLPAYENVAPDSTKLEDYRSRMRWITNVANQFHELMRSHPGTMEAELSAMASWVGQRDSIRYPGETLAR